MPSDKQFQIPSPVEPLSDPWLAQQQIQVDVKRDDLIHPLISGNKYRKLSGHLPTINQSSPTGLITMGGVWSNHVHACAYWARTLGLACTVLLRGPKPKQPNQLLQDLAQWGTEIRFLTRNDYRALRLAYEHDQLDSISHLKDFPGYLFIPEGGYHPLAQSGIRQLAEEIQDSYKAVYIAVGTGTTVGGLISSWPDDDCHFYGIQAVTATASQERIIHSFLQHQTGRITLCANYQFGGFARVNDELIDFMLAMYAKTGLITEPVYTAKTLFALYDHVKQGKYRVGDRLLFIHTGGLQGLRGFQQTRLKALCSSAGFT